MKNLEVFEKKYLEKIKETKKIPDFNPGDTIIVYVKVKEKKRIRDQAYEGVCISKKNSGINSSFTVRKVSYGEGVERVFPLYSPLIDKLEVIRRGDVRRAKLYYIRERSGKKARIAEKRVDNKIEEVKVSPSEESFVKKEEPIKKKEPVKEKEAVKKEE